MPEKYIAYVMIDSHTAEYREIGRFTSRVEADRAAKKAVGGDARRCDAPCFAAIQGGGYWHPDKSAIAAFQARADKGNDDSLVAWIMVAAGTASQ